MKKSTARIITAIVIISCLALAGGLFAISMNNYNKQEGTIEDSLNEMNDYMQWIGSDEYEEEYRQEMERTMERNMDELEEMNNLDIFSEFNE